MCEVGGCERVVYARGHCERHYRQRLRRGAVRPDAATQECSVPSCERAAVTRGWCHGHYLRWTRTGDVGADVPLGRRQRPTCRISGCGRPHHSNGLCRTHRAREEQRGQARPELPVRAPRPGGGSISHGYRKVVVRAEDLHLTRGERNVLQHRLVMAQLLGRPLEPDEVVHHRNGDRLDNRPANLELWSVCQPKGQRVEDKIAYAYEILATYDREAWARLRPDAGPPGHLE